MPWKIECYEKYWKPLNVGVLKNSGSTLQSEIFCLTAVIVAWLYAAITALRQNISLWSAGPEMAIHINESMKMGKILLLEYWKTLFIMPWKMTVMKLLKNLECWEYWKILFIKPWKTEHYEKLENLSYENFSILFHYKNDITVCDGMN